MYSSKTGKHYKAYTIEEAEEQLRNITFDTTQVTTAVCHVGRNDLPSHDSDAVIDSLKKLSETAKQKFPAAKIGISAILPKIEKDAIVHNNILYINGKLKDLCKDDDRLIFIPHRKLSESRHLYAKDGVHLNKEGVRLLVADMKWPMLKRRGKPIRQEQQRQSNKIRTGTYKSRPYGRNQPHFYRERDYMVHQRNQRNEPQHVTLHANIMIRDRMDK